MNVLKEALAAGMPALDEYRAKQFLAASGIPVSREMLALDPEAAAAAAGTIGFPVVLKVVGPTLYHKTEVGGVVLDLKSSEEVMAESDRLLKIPGCQALLVQEMVRGERELVCGMTRDAQLGPCVMFGLGGILTETLDDAAFRVAPLTISDALEMMQEVRSARILGPFRGQPPADLEALSGVLVTLGKIGAQYDEVLAIDLNPVKIRSNGMPVAVDALISLVVKEPARR